MSTHLVKHGNRTELEPVAESQIIDVEPLPIDPQLAADLKGISGLRKTLFWVGCLWCFVAFVPWPDALKGFMDYVFFGLHFFGIIVVCLLASALKKKAWPYALLSFVGILNLGIYIHLICEAAKVLKEHNSR